MDLEDLVFGCEPPGGGRGTPAGENPRQPIRYMLPLLACVVMILIVLWSLSKSIQYTEVFQANARYQYALWGLNVVVIVLATLVILSCRRVGGDGTDETMITAPQTTPAKSLSP